MNPSGGNANEDLSSLMQRLRVSANIQQPANNFRSMDQGLANVYVFEMKPTGALVYRYDVEITVEGRDKSLTTGAGDDGKKGLLRDLCYQIVKTTFDNTNAFNSNGAANFVYDNRKILYTNVKVDAMTRQIPPDRMTEFCRRYLNNAAVKFELQPCQDQSAHVVDLNNIGRALQPAPHQQADRSMLSFLEMLTSQPFINAGTHKLVGAGRLFEVQEKKRLNEALTTHSGLAKGVRVVANGGVKPCPALVADVKTCAFFVSDNLEKIANAMIQSARNRRRLDPNDKKQMETFWQDFGQLYKGVSASLTYAPSRVIVIDSMSARTCGQMGFEVDGQSMSMVDFFRTKKNTTINPNLPAVRQHVDRDSVYPLSCLQILPFQRLSLDKMGLNEEMSNISKDLLAANAVGPAQRYAAIETEMRKIGANDDVSKFMRSFYVCMKARNEVDIGLLPLPGIQFGNNQQQQQDNRGRFDVRGPVRYLEPSKSLTSWVVARPRKLSGENRIEKFIQDLKQMAQRRGMVLPQPHFEEMELNDMERKFEEFKRNKVNFLFYVDNRYVKSHSSLKLFERKNSLLTQHVTVEMLQKAGPASISNVLNKMNMKLFGLNYLPIPPQVCKDKFDLASGNLLVIGIDTSRPPRATAFERFQLKKAGMEDLSSDEPMVVGFCANYVENPSKFCGDYYYQPTRQDQLEPEFLMAKMKWMLDLVKMKRKNPPKTIFIIRDGISEGMVPNLLDTEFKAIVESCRRFHPTWKPNFVFCIVDKRHNKRFFVKQQGGQQQQQGGNGRNVQAENTKPGSVIDRKFVRVDMHEFFLQAHFPLKGVSKIPQYVFPINQVNANNSELQAFLLSLCNMWQIVNLAPALPTPVLQAKELAKRGRNNYVEFKHNHPQRVPYVAGKGDQRFRMINYEALNRMLGYELIDLSKTRFNA